MKPEAVKIEPAATVIIVKDTQLGIEVLMQQRNAKASFGANAWVFPGGKLSAGDYSDEWQAHCDCISSSLAERSKATEFSLAYWIAAVREVVEEAGILLAHTANQRVAQTAQQHLLQDPDSFLAFCQHRQLRLATSKLHYLSRWITPPSFHKRYDTRFFFTRWPSDQPPRQDGYEAVDTCWITPQEALDRHRSQSWLLMRPTLATLTTLTQFHSAQELEDRFIDCCSAPNEP